MTSLASDIAELWAEVLGSAPETDQSDFFASGGTSIAAAALVARARVRTGRGVGLPAFVAEPTPAGLARALDAAPALVSRDGPDEPAPSRTRPSLAQERFWYIDQTTGGHPVSNVPWAVRLRGSLDAERLDRALREVVDRHEALRTRFEADAGQPVAVIDPTPGVVLAQIDLSGDPDPETALSGRLDDLCLTRFDLAAGPLLRAELIRLAGDEHVLGLVAHHIVCDDWSKGIILRELGEIYTGLGDHGSPSLPAPAQYRGFVEAQRDGLDEATVARELAHWQHTLAGAPAALELPADRQRPASPTLQGTRLRTPLPAPIVQELRALGRRHGATLFMTMLAALDALLVRYTDQSDLVVGTAIDNRGRRELEDTVGLLTNVLPLRVEVPDGASFTDLLARARAATLDAIAHQDLPFDRVAAQAPRDSSRHPIFQVFYEFIVPAPVELPIPGVTVTPLAVARRGAEFDLGLYLDEQHGGLHAVWEYSRDLFEPETIARLSGHFLTLLGAIAASPDRPVAELELLDAAEREQLLADFNATERPVDMTPVHERFEAVAARAPGHPALRVGDTVLTYAELNRRVNQIAHRLMATGVKPGSAVGIALPRTPDLIAALLGALKAGGAYLPLNPDHPAARHEQQLAQASAAGLICAGDPPPGYAGPVIRLPDPGLGEQPEHDPGVPRGPGDLAYILYTSGSTGVPKGVMVTHGNLANYVGHMLGALGPVEGLEFASVSALSTDLGNTTIFPSLAGGGCLHLVDTDTSTDAAAFAAALATHPIDVLKITPSHLSALLDGAGDAVLPRRCLLIGGERLSWDLAERVARPGGPRALNHYGPTEATIGCATFEIDPGAPRPASASVPIGRPISNVYIHLLDRLGSPVPVGLPGELYIGGAGVARGYIGAAEQTARAFVADPVRERSTARCYRTGDLARYLPGGAIEFLGRADAQVKIRGFRVEPGEVEVALARLPGVGRAAVIARGEGEGTHLIAFVTPEGEAPAPAALHDALTAVLPPYMIPAAIHVLDRLPLTPNGKLDRAALARTEEAVPERQPEQPDSAPTDTEAVLAGIWAQVLGHAVGPQDNFFEVGGHSLLAIRLVARLRKEMGVKLTLKALTDAPTIRALAARIAPSVSPTEAVLAGIWAQVLGHAVGPQDNFFEVGGHSLLAIRLVARLRKEMGVKLTLKALIDAPTIRALAARIDATGAGSAPVARAVPEPPTPIPVVSRAAPLPAGYAQEQFWLVEQLTPGSTAYNFSWPLRLTGALDVDALSRAVAEVVRRHEPLRTRFSAPDGEPVQIIDAPGVGGLDVVDLSQAPDPEQAALRRVDELTRTPFDLTRGPLLRVELIRTGGEAHVLAIVVHHIVFDGVSKIVLYRELGELYGAFATGRAAALPELSLQYGDWSQWQRNELQGAHLDAELDFWREALRGAPTQLDLSADRPRPPRASLRGARHRAPVPRELRAELEALARRDGATFFQVMLAAFDVLLYRYSGQEDILVGVPVDTRSAPELEQVIGPFLNTVVVRGDLSGSPTFRELLARVRARTLDAIAHQELPFERVVQALAPERDLSRHPIFQTLIALNPPETGLRLAGLEVDELDPGWAAARVDLFLVLDDLSHGLDAVWEYSTDLFDAATVQRMSGHFLALLHAIAAEPDRGIDRLELLRDGERTRVLHAFNDTGAPIPAGRLEELIAAQSRRTPGRVAVRHGDAQLTYAELETRSQRLAERLREAGAGPAELVGICLGRSEQLLVALLGVLKTGAAYVPIDPAFPLERRQFMLRDAGVHVLVGEADLLEGLPLDEVTVVAPGDGPAAPVAAWEAGDADALAYVIYTSGSTGRPKGVEIAHRALVNFLHAMGERPGLGGEDVLLALTTLSFDIAGLELYLPLLHGATVVVAQAAAGADPRLLAELLTASGATVMQATPTTWRMLVEADWPGRPGLKALCGGEALGPGLAQALLDRGLELWNLYGPTETTIWSSAAALMPGEAVSIGHPIANTQFYVLDSRGEPCPIGVPGELHIGGAGLARGYRGRPELTAERFVTDPFAAAPEARMYRTGDLAKVRPDGRVDYLGRLDTQVKIRGFRIELGEIEARLAEHPAVAAAVLTSQPGPAGEPVLVAYTIAAGAAAPGGELQRFLADRLPAYMVPATFVDLESFPLTPNAKVDRRALPPPQAWGTGGAGEYVAPASGDEARLAALWSDLLGRDRIGATDDFFALGGHSLLAARLMGRVAAEFGVGLPLSALFEAPTVATLAARIRAAATPEPAQAAQPGAVTTALPAPPPLMPIARTRRLSYAQERFWFIDQLTGASAAYNIPWALRLRGSLDVDALRRALSEIVRRHESLRTRYAVRDGEPVGIVDPPAPMALEPIDLRGGDDPDRAAVALADRETQRPFDLQAGPVLRATLARTADDEHVLIIVVHHIAADGASKQVLLSELDTLYTALSTGRPPALPELAVQYGDYAEWERGWLTGERLAAELEHWRAELDGAPTALELTGDRPRPDVATLAGAWLRATVDRDIADGVRALGVRHRATTFMTMLAALQVFLHRLTGQDEIVVGSAVDTRRAPELQSAIGAFVNTVAIRGDVAGAPAFTEVLEGVRDATLRAIAHQDAPFERVVEAVAVERDLSRHPLCQVLLTVVPPEPSPRLGSLAVSEIETAKTTSRVDLTLLVREAPDGLDLVWEYSTDLFDRESVARMAEQFACLLAEIVAAPQRSIDELSLASPAQRAELVARWGATGPAHPVRCLHETFQARAAQTPDAVAVRHETQSLTYRELNARANRLARRLRALGIGPDALVGLCLERSPDMIVAILAVLKAGGAYVPLDPAHPEDRIAFTLQDSQAPLVLTQTGLADRVQSSGTRVVCLEDEQPAIDAHDAGDLEPLAQPTNLAYVIYTSGSTGRPKGVLIEHQQVSRLFTATDAWFSPGPQDVWTLLHSYAFDFSVWELWGALLHGGTVIVVPQWVTRSPAALAELIAAEGVTMLSATPSLFAAVMDELIARASELSLRSVVFGGEALRTSSLRRWFERFGDERPRLVNMYGITETTVHVTYRPLRASDALLDHSPIGEPIGDLQLYLLDAGRRPVAEGVPGELYVGGAGVARGYLNRPELTAQRFAPNPFGPGRLYRTGDRARWHPRRGLEFEGRMDDQVKIRGFRIELGEIASALSDSELVAEAVVSVFEATAGDPRLAAYVVPSAAGRATEPAALRSGLRAGLSERLPEYMVPASIALLDALPLTANGKLDRRALPVPERELEDAVLAPETATEQALLELWRELLGAEQIGVGDDFFALGGHSLLVARLVGEIRERLGAPVSIRTVFAAPSIRALAAHIDAASHGDGASAPAEPTGGVSRAPAGAPIPLSYTQEQLWLIDQWDPGAPTYNVVLPFRVHGRLDVDALKRALEAMIERHEALRTVIALDGETPVPVTLPAAPVTVSVIDLTGHPQAEREVGLTRALDEIARRPFDFARDVLLRASVIVLGDEDRVLVLQTHHIVFDGGSETALLDQLQTLYAGGEVPAPRLQYRDFAYWQRHRLAGERLDAELDFWRGQLAGAPTRVELPFDHPRPTGQRFRGASHPIALDADAARAIRELGAQERATPYIVVLAALSTLLYRITGQDDVLIGSPYAHRPSPDLQDLIGFFSNTLVFRSRLAGNPSFRDLLARTREMALDVYAHEDVPFEMVVHAVRPSREVGVNPLFQVNLRVATQPRGVLTLPGAEITPLAVDVGFTRFDLALDLQVLDTGVRGYFRYNRDMFEPTTITALADAFTRLLADLLAEPDERLLSFSVSGELRRDGEPAAPRPGIRGLRRGGALR